MKALQFVSPLNVSKFKESDKKIPENNFNHLKEAYGGFFDISKLRTELQYLYSSSEFSSKSFNDIKKLIIMMIYKKMC